jgi:hypothetical protein
MALLTMAGEPGAYAGTLKSTLVKDFTSVASGVEEIDLPRGLDYLRLIVSAFEAGTAPQANVTNVRLDTNNLEQVYIDSPWDDLAELNQIWFNLWPEWAAHVFRSDTDQVSVPLSSIQNYGVDTNEDVNITNDTIIFDRVDTVTEGLLTLNSSEGDFTSGASDLTAYTTDHDIFVRALGRGLPYATVLDFRRMLADGVLASAKFDRVRLSLTQGNAGAAVRCVLQELRKLG